MKPLKLIFCGSGNYILVLSAVGVRAFGRLFYLFTKAGFSDDDLWS